MFPGYNLLFWNPVCDDETPHPALSMFDCDETPDHALRLTVPFCSADHVDLNPAFVDAGIKEAARTAWVHHVAGGDYVGDTPTDSMHYSLDAYLCC